MHHRERPIPIPLLATKLYLPRARQTLVHRPRLVARLEAGLAGAVTLISAPAGFGKTTVLSAWLGERMQRQPPTVAWVSLDADDSDVLQWLRYVVAALQTCTPAAALTTLQLLEAPQAPALPALLRVLINDLAGPGRRDHSSSSTTTMSSRAPPSMRRLRSWSTTSPHACTW